jgi:hypothetical protein
MSALSWAKFFAILLPELSDLARELYRRHQGNADGARAELATIRDHGARLRAAEAEIDSRLDAVRTREKGP